MKKETILVFIMLISNWMFGQEPVIVEITDSTLPSVYYHQNNFTVPTKLVFTNLTSVNGSVFFNKNTNLVAVEFPKLVSTADCIYFDGNISLEIIDIPKLTSVKNYIYVTGQTSLKELNICNLKEIKGSSAYWYIVGNNATIDNTPVCFNHATPTNLQIDNTTIQENKEKNTVIGTLSADSTLAGELTYTVNNSSFIISGNKLLSNSSFDYETTNQYKIKITVRNQLGEKLQREIVINVLDVTNENIKTVEITDETLDNVYYYQNSFTEPTKLVFTNLTSVNGYVFFHQNANLVAVEFPKLISTKGYFYFDGNKSLEIINAPSLTSVNENVYVTGQPLLKELNICNLKQIKGSSAYWYIASNNSTIDNTPVCFTHGAPTNLQIDNTSIEENKNINTLIATLSADSAIDTSLTYTVNNKNFIIVGNQLFTNSPFDFESQNQYKIKIGVRNQFGEKLEREITINVIDITDEVITTIEITDTTLDNIYYHKDNSFITPTKLVFNNLTSVEGNIYFYQNVNLVAVELPKLVNSNDYFFVNGNPSLQKIDAPSLKTVTDYLYVSDNKLLEKLNICNLSQIVSNKNSGDRDSYYYIKNNPNLDYTTTCLTNTYLSFNPVEKIIVKPAPNTLIGTFSTDAGNDAQIRYFFVDENGIETTNENFIIVENNIYLAKEYSEYTTLNYNLDINALRGITKNVLSKTTRKVASNSINEKIDLNFSLNIENAILGLNNFSNKKQMAIYPNPAKNYFNIDSEISFDTANLFDLTGKHIKSFQSNKNTYDISNIPSGLYLIRLTQKDNSTTLTEKLIIE